MNDIFIKSFLYNIEKEADRFSVGVTSEDGRVTYTNVNPKNLHKFLKKKSFDPRTNNTMPPIVYYYK